MEEEEGEEEEEERSERRSQVYPEIAKKHSETTGIKTAGADRNKTMRKEEEDEEEGKEEEKRNEKSAAAATEKVKESAEEKEKMKRVNAMFWCDTYLNHPLPLIELSRISIRRHLGFSLAESKSHPQWERFPCRLRNFIFLEFEDIC